MSISQILMKYTVKYTYIHRKKKSLHTMEKQRIAQ